MERVIKIVVFIILAVLLLFLILRNISGVEEANRNLPSEEELSEFNNVSSKSSDNSYEVKDIPNKELATIYYNHFKNLVVNDLEGAYKRVRNKDAVLLEDFQMFRADLINNYYSNKVVSYEIRNGDNSSTYTIVNSNNQTIIFYVDAVFKYEVELLLW